MIDHCIFCKIVSGQAAAEIVYQDQLATAFWDIRPVAPVHILIVPNQHLESVNQVAPEHEALLGHLFNVARQVAADQGIQQSGYRLVVNTGPNSGQVVFHLHVHILGGQRLRFPMG